MTPDFWLAMIFVLTTATVGCGMLVKIRRLERQVRLLSDSVRAVEKLHAKGFYIPPAYRK